MNRKLVQLTAITFLIISILVFVLSRNYSNTIQASSQDNQTVFVDQVLPANILEQKALEEAHYWGLQGIPLSVDAATMTQGQWMGIDHINATTEGLGGRSRNSPVYVYVAQGNIDLQLYGEIDSSEHYSHIVIVLDGSTGQLIETVGILEGNAPPNLNNRGPDPGPLPVVPTLAPYEPGE